MGNGSTTLSPQVLSDLSESTDFSVDEIRHYYKAFLKECDQHRMTVDPERFKQLYKTIFPQGDPTRFAEQVFRTFDTDGNGRIDFREFMMSVSIQQKGTDKDKLQYLFNLFDLDGTGCINMGELITLVESLRKLRGSHGHTDTATATDIAQHIMAGADHNRDSKLSLDEFLDSAITSTTMQGLLQGALAASSTPFVHGL